jgi:hypothetical protein
MKRASVFEIVLAVFIGLLFAYQMLDFWVFRHAGARFTAKDGDELCLRVQALEKHAGIPVSECSYSVKK